MPSIIASTPNTGNHGAVPDLQRDTQARTRTSPMRIMARLLGERRGLFAGNLGLRLVKDLLPFQGPILVGIIVDLLSGTDRWLFGIDLTPNDTRSIVIVAIFLGLLAVAKTVIGYVHTIVAAHMGRHVVQAARRDLAEASMQMALDERRRFNSGDLLDRCLADSKGLRSFTQNVIIRIISNTVRAIYPLTLMFLIDPLLAVVVLAVIPLQSGLSALLQRRLQRQTREARSREAAHTSAVKEAIDGWNNVASVGGQDWAAQGIHDTAAASEDAKIVKKHTTAAISAVITLCTALGIAAVYAIGGWRIIESGVLDGDAASGALTLGTLTTFVGVAKKTYAPFRAYTKIVSDYRTGLVNLERIADVLDAPVLDPRNNGPALRVDNGEIVLDDVSFTYRDGDSPTLRQLSGAIPGRSLTVITGSSGAGKTTLLRLLLGLDVPGTGTISIDGQDINVTNLASVQSAIALVPQEPVLFSGTMRDNLLLGLENTTSQQLLEACDRSGLLDLVRQLPQGLETPVGSGKHMLSGGQLRRMAIARALLRKPSVLLLDEPTTGLDVQNSTLVLNTLRRISDRTTVVMVSHRSEPLRASDHHLILKDGGWSRGEISRTDELATRTTTPTAQTPVARRPADTTAISTTAARAHAPATNTSPATIASANGASTNGASTNGASTNGAVTNGALAAFTSTHGASTNGSHAEGEEVPDSASTYQHVIGLSAMGRPIIQTDLHSPQAATRIMLLSGHRSLVRPVTAIAPSVFAQAAQDRQHPVSLASIEDVNPDGAYSARRETVLGVDIETDHELRRAAETWALHKALEAWDTDVIIDVAELPSAQPGSIDVEVAIRYAPLANARVPAELVQLEHNIRLLLNNNDFSYNVRLKGCLPGSVTDALHLTTIELTAQHHDDARVLPAIIAAVGATRQAVLVLRAAKSGPTPTATTATQIGLVEPAGLVP